MNATGLIRGGLAGVFAALALVVSSTAVAVPPVMGIIGPIDIEGSFIADCGGYGVLADWTVAAPFTEHYDQDGQLTHIEYFQQVGPVTFYNSTMPDVQVVGKKGIEVARWDFTKGSIATMGQRFKVSLPGYGLVHVVAGHIEIDMATFGITFVAGQPGFLAGDAAALCAAVAS